MLVLMLQRIFDIRVVFCRRRCRLECYVDESRRPSRERRALQQGCPEIGKGGEKVREPRRSGGVGGPPICRRSLVPLVGLQLSRGRTARRECLARSCAAGSPEKIATTTIPVPGQEPKRLHKYPSDWRCGPGLAGPGGRDIAGKGTTRSRSTNSWEPRRLCSRSSRKNSSSSSSRRHHSKSR